MQDKIVRFVCFETILNKDEFMQRWEKFTRSLNSNADVTLQQSQSKGSFSYVAQHRFAGDELDFKFSNEGRNSRVVQVPVKIISAGGYSSLQLKRTHEAARNESKILLFINDPQADINVYKNLSADADLNIYQAYYENCKFAYIFEYFVKTKNAEELLAQLQTYNITQAGIYKEWTHIKNNAKELKNFAWPTV